jgi:glycerol-3-phosphate dehydrogenase
MWEKGWRDSVWADLDRPWDIIVIGGGITGAGILREAARASLRVLLLEAQDFASGTSGRSSKLVHGGLRYLRHGQLRTTISSVHEREQLLREGKGLVTSLGFFYVGYQRDRLPLWLFGIGLALYDLLGLRWGHKRYEAKDLARLTPILNQAGLLGGYRYFDAQTDDARLVLRVIREGVRAGGLALNYARAEKLLRLRDGKVCGVVVCDRARDGRKRTCEIQGTVVVNATGFEADELRGQIGNENRLRALRGSHLLFSADRIPLKRAVSFSHPSDQRPVFVLPWEGVTLFGTTDVDHPPDKGGEPSIDRREIDYLMTALGHAFPVLGLTEQDIQATFSGVRAVVDTGKANPSKESREHVLWRESGLLTVTGGKLTTFRVMARDALRAVRGILPGKPRFRSSRILDRQIDVSGINDLSHPVRWRLIGRYGHDAPLLVKLARPGELSLIDQKQQVSALWAELRWAARHEGVVHLDDLLL